MAVVWIPLMPLDLVVFPGERIPLRVYEERHHLMVDEVEHTGIPFGIALARPDTTPGRIEHDPVAIGTAVRLADPGTFDGDDRHIEVLGLRRFKVHAVRSTRPFQEARIGWLDEPAGSPAAIRAAFTRLRSALGLMGFGRGDVREILGAEPVTASYRVAMALDADARFLQSMLEAPDAARRIELACGHIIAQTGTGTRIT